MGNGKIIFRNRNIQKQCRNLIGTANGKTMGDILASFAEVPARIKVKFNWKFRRSIINPLHSIYGNRGPTSLIFSEGFGMAAETLRWISVRFAGTSLSLPAGFGQNAIDMSNCFQHNKDKTKLRVLSLPEGCGRKAKTLRQCFANCANLTNLALSDGFGAASTDNTGAFDGCAALTNITGNPQFKTSVGLSDSPLLTVDSLRIVINGLQTVTEAQTLTLGEANKAKLTEAQIKIATDKGWTVA